MRPVVPLRRLRDPRGFTLIEILVASAVLVIFAAAAIAILQGATRMWREHESVSETYVRALDVLKRIQTDLEQRAYPHDDEFGFAFREELEVIDDAQALSGADLRPRDVVWRRGSPASLMQGEDLSNRNYFCLTRYLPDELSAQPRFGLSGMRDEASPQDYWLPHQRSHNVRALENLSEVSWVFSPFPRYRGRMTNGTSFTADLIEASLARRLHVEGEDLDFSQGGFVIGREVVPNTPEFVEPNSLEFVGHGLYRGFVAPPPLERVPGEHSPGSLYWLLGPVMQEMHQVQANEGRSAALELFLDDFYRMHEWVADGILYVGSGAGWYQRDPRAMPPELHLGLSPQANRTATVTVTAESLGPIKSRARLARELDVQDTELYLTNTELLPFPRSGQQFLLIEDEEGRHREWVGYARVRGNRVEGLTRGVRGTVRSGRTIPRGTLVRWGVTLQTRVFLHNPTIPTSPRADASSPRGDFDAGFARGQPVEPESFDLFD